MAGGVPWPRTSGHAGSGRHGGTMNKKQNLLRGWGKIIVVDEARSGLQFARQISKNALSGDELERRFFQ